MARYGGDALARGCDAGLLGLLYFSARHADRDVWSAGYQPSGVEADDYEVSFSEERAEIIRRDGDWSTTLRGRGVVRG